jgi:isopenicillin N synthase-like dioxygenase
MSDGDAGAAGVGGTAVGGLYSIAADTLADPSPEATATIAEAARRHGMLYLARHGAADEIAAAMSATRAFFALPFEERMSIAARGAQDSGYRGADRSAQILALTRTSQPHPLFGDIRWPANPAGFQPIIEAYLDRMRGLATRVLSGVARGLGLEADFFDATFGPGAIENLQLRHYDAQPPHNPVPLDAHSDPPPITLIAQDEVGGLDTLCEGRWVPVRPIADTLVCQFGAMMSRWTDDLYPANVHRVRCEERASRFSIVYNLLPRRDAVVERVPTCRSNAASRHAAAVSLDAFLGGNLPVDGGASRAPPAQEERTIDEPTLARCREVVHRGSAGRWSLERASRSDASVRLRLHAGAEVIELEMSRVQEGRRYYRSVGAVGFSYRDRIAPECLPVLDRLIQGLAASLAPSFDA